MGEIIEFKAKVRQKQKVESSTSSKRFKISSEIIIYLISIILAGAFVFLCFTNYELAMIIASLVLVVAIIISFGLSIFRI